MSNTVNFQIKGRFDGAVRFECQVDASLTYGEKMGFAVKAALRARANLADANLARAYLTGAYLVRANLTGADLTGANLTGAYLARANLADAKLTGADLTGANLAGADLAGAYLTGANLAGAYLAGADLAGAYLAGAYLAGAYLARANLTGAKWRAGIVITKTPIQIYNLIWLVVILDTHMQIGCELHSHAEWRNFDDRRIVQMDGREALKFWRLHKEILLRLCDLHAGKVEDEA